MTTLYIARHGQTEWNLAERIQGQTDVQLTEKGEEQARELRDRLKDIHFDAIFTSDLSRAHNTAQIVAEGRSKELKASAHLREKSQGLLEGYHREKARMDFKEMYDLMEAADEQARMTFKIVPDSESLQDAADRFTHQIGQIIKEHTDETVLVVAHGGVMRAFLHNVGLIRFDDIDHIDNTGYFIVESDGEKYRLIDTYGVKWLAK